MLENSQNGILRMDSQNGRLPFGEDGSVAKAWKECSCGWQGIKVLGFSYQDTEAIQMRSIGLEPQQMYKTPCSTPVAYTTARTPDFFRSLPRPFCMLSSHTQSHQHPGWRRMVRAFPSYTVVHNVHLIEGFTNNGSLANKEEQPCMSQNTI